MSDSPLTRPLVDPLQQRRRRRWIALAVVLAFVALVIAHLV
jgi:predicted PurR-regulated permease PerM